MWPHQECHGPPISSGVVIDRIHHPQGHQQNVRFWNHNIIFDFMWKRKYTGLPKGFVLKKISIGVDSLQFVLRQKQGDRQGRDGLQCGQCQWCTLGEGSAQEPSFQICLSSTTINKQIMWSGKESKIFLCEYKCNWCIVINIDDWEVYLGYMDEKYNWIKMLLTISAKPLPILMFSAFSWLGTPWMSSCLKYFPTEIEQPVARCKEKLVAGFDTVHWGAHRREVVKNGKCLVSKSKDIGNAFSFIYQLSCEVHDFVRRHVYCLSLGLFPSICFIKMCVWWNKSWEILMNNTSPAVHLVEEGLKNYWISSTQLKQCSGVLSKTKRRRVCFRGVSQIMVPNHICDNMQKTSHC